MRTRVGAHMGPSATASARPHVQSAGTHSIGTVEADTLHLSTKERAIEETLGKLDSKNDHVGARACAPGKSGFESVNIDGVVHNMKVLSTTGKAHTASTSLVLEGSNDHSNRERTCVRPAKWREGPYWLGMYDASDPTCR